jgi:hypothetical protein
LQERNLKNRVIFVCEKITPNNLPNGTFELYVEAHGSPTGLVEYEKNCVPIPEFGSLALMIMCITIVGLFYFQNGLNCNCHLLIYQCHLQKYF